MNMTTSEALLDLKTPEEVTVMKTQLKSWALEYGQEVEISANYTDHGFEVGERVLIIDVADAIGLFRAISLDEQFFDYVLDGEFKKI